jgi:cytoskeletal protein CcmA (bactofilin family)
MFHRVKSEVQDAELQNQEQSENGMASDDERHSQAKEEPKTHEEMTAPAPRKYGYTPIKTQEEKIEMKEQEEENVQGKYAPVKSEREEEVSQPQASTNIQRVSSYQPSLARPSYAGSSYGTTSSHQKPEMSLLYGGSSDRTLTIGRGINMSGEIDACDHLLVEGTVEAALKGAKVLDIAESGTFYGTVEIEEATIAGRFEGDITVNGRLTLKASGIITGSISYRELEVEAGAVIDGRMTPLKGEVNQKSIDSYRAGSEATAMAKTSIKKDSARTPVNTEGSGLFSKARASYQ